MEAGISGCWAHLSSPWLLAGPAADSSVLSKASQQSCSGRPGGSVLAAALLRCHPAPPLADAPLCKVSVRQQCSCRCCSSAASRLPVTHDMLAPSRRGGARPLHPFPQGDSGDHLSLRCRVMGFIQEREEEYKFFM